MNNLIEIRDERRGPWLRLLGWATLVAGTLDALDGVVFFGLHGLNPIQVLQYIASGWLGAAAFSGGLAAAGLGALIHYGIAFVVAAVYLAAVRSVPALRGQWVVAGLLYGAAVYLVMTYGVLPHSAVAPSPVTPAAFANGILGHALFVGLPIARILRKA
jgi:uncharacterized membrane protein YagU involved in acid resistance